MENVTVVVIEDRDIDDTIDLSSKSKGGFRFVKHDSFDTRIAASFEKGIEGAESFNKYRNFLSGREGPWERLEGYAIIIADLGLEAGLDLEDYKEMDLDQQIQSWAETWPGDDKQQQGLYLLGEALKNREWRGVIYISTGAGHHETAETKVEDFRDLVNPPLEVVIDSAPYAINKAEASDAVVDGAIEVFLENFGDIQRKLFP